MWYKYVLSKRDQWIHCEIPKGIQLLLNKLEIEVNPETFYRVFDVNPEKLGILYLTDEPSLTYIVCEHEQVLLAIHAVCISHYFEAGVNYDYLLDNWCVSYERQKGDVVLRDGKTFMYYQLITHTAITPALITHCVSHNVKSQNAIDVLDVITTHNWKEHQRLSDYDFEEDD